MNYDPNQWRPQQPAPHWGAAQWTPGPPNPGRKPGAWQRLTRSGKVTVVCLTIAVVLFSCILCSSGFHDVGTPAKPQTASLARTALPTVQPTPTKKPTPKPTARPTRQPAVAQPTTQPQTGPTYNTDPTGGNKVYDPPVDFCTSHVCVSTFWKDTSGYVVECGNGEFSHSGGVHGACSRDGGVAAVLYQHG